jgi:hypothetical protein
MRTQILSLTLLLMFAHTEAQQENGSPGNDTPEPTQTSTGSSTTTPAQEPAESFIPSEIISEDLSVPFPVDI